MATTGVLQSPLMTEAVPLITEAIYFEVRPDKKPRFGVFIFAYFV